MKLYYYIKRRRKKLTHGLCLILFLFMISLVFKKHQKIITIKDDDSSTNKTETCTALFVVLHFRITNKNHSPIHITESIKKHIKSKLESYTNTSHQYMFVDQNISDNGLPQSMQDSAYYIQGPSERRGQCGYVWGFDNNDKEIRYDTCKETNLKNSWKFCKLERHLLDEDETQKTSAHYDKHCVPNLAAGWPLQHIGKCTSNQEDMTIWTNYAKNLDKNLLNNTLSEYIEYSINAWQVLGLVVEYDKELLQTSFSVLSSPKTTENAIKGVVSDQDVSSTPNSLKTTMAKETIAAAQTKLTPDTKSSTIFPRSRNYQPRSTTLRQTTTLAQMEKQRSSQHAALENSPVTQASQLSLARLLTTAKIEPTSIILSQKPTSFTKTHAASTLLNSVSIEVPSSTTPIRTTPGDNTQLFATTLDIPEETHPFVLAEQGNEVFNEQIYNEMMKKLYPELFSKTETTPQLTGYFTSSDKMPDSYEGSGMLSPDDVQEGAVAGDSHNTETPNYILITDEPRKSTEKTTANGLLLSSQEEYVTTTNVNVMDDIIALKDLVNKIYGVILDDLPVPLDKLLSRIHNATDHTHVDLSNTELKGGQNENQFPKHYSDDAETVTQEVLDVENIKQGKTPVTEQPIANTTNNSVVVQFDKNNNAEVGVTAVMSSTSAETSYEISDAIVNDIVDKSATPPNAFNVDKTNTAAPKMHSPNSGYITTLTDFTQQTTKLAVAIYVDNSLLTTAPGSGTPIAFMTTDKEIVQATDVLSNTEVAPVVLQTTYDSYFETPSIEAATATLGSETITSHRQLEVPTTSENLNGEWYKTTPQVLATLLTDHSDLEKTSTTIIDETTSNLVNIPAKVLQAKVPSSLDIDIPQYSASHEDVTSTTFSELYTTQFSHTLNSTKDITDSKTLVQYSSVLSSGVTGSITDTEAPLPDSTVLSDITTEDFLDENYYSTYGSSDENTFRKSNITQSANLESSSQVLTTYSTNTTNAGIISLKNTGSENPHSTFSATPAVEYVETVRLSNENSFRKANSTPSANLESSSQVITTDSTSTTNAGISLRDTKNPHSTFSATPPVENVETVGLSDENSFREANSTPHANLESSSQVITIDSTSTTNASNSLNSTESGSNTNKDATVKVRDQSTSNASIVKYVTSIPTPPSNTNANDTILDIPKSSPSSFDIIDNSGSGSGFTKNISETSEAPTWHTSMFKNNPTQGTLNAMMISLGTSNAEEDTLFRNTTPNNLNFNKTESSLPNFSTKAIVQLTTDLNPPSTSIDLIESSISTTGDDSTEGNPTNLNAPLTDGTTSRIILDNKGIANQTTADTSISDRSASFISSTPGDDSTASYATTSISTTLRNEDSTSLFASHDATSISMTSEDTLVSTLQIDHNFLANTASSTSTVSTNLKPENEEATKKSSKPLPRYSFSLPTITINYSTTPFTTSNTPPSTSPSAITPIIDVTSTTVGKWFEYNLPSTWKKTIKDNDASIIVNLSTVKNVQNSDNQLLEARWLRYHKGFEILCGVPIGKNGTDVSQISTFIIQILTDSNVLAQVTLHVSLFPMSSTEIPEYIITLHMNTKASEKDDVGMDFSDKSPAAFVQKLTSHLQMKSSVIRHSSINLLQFHHMVTRRKKTSLVSSIKALWNIENSTMDEFYETFGAAIISPVSGDVAQDFFLSMLPQFIINRVGINSTSNHHLSSNNSPQQHIDQQENILHSVMPPLLIGVFIVILCVVLLKVCKKKRPMYYITERFRDRTFGPNRKPVFLDEEIEMSNLRPQSARIMQEDILNINQTPINFPMEMNIDRSRVRTVSSRSIESTNSSTSSQRDSEDGFYSFTHASFHLTDE